jgi:nitrogen fixation NifU-like protein
MSELRDLYQDIILDHGRKPRNFRSMDAASHRAEGHNPLCGDRLSLFLKIKDGVVEDLSFEGSGCAISTASASLLTEALQGKSEEEARELIAEFVQMATTPKDEEVEKGNLGKLSVFAGVREFPMRVKCATLSWHTLENALDGQEEAAKTE